MQLLKQCPLCESEDLKPHSMKVDKNAPHISRVVCINCSLVFANPMATLQELNVFYSNYYDKGNFGLFQYKKLHLEKFEEYRKLDAQALANKFKSTLDYKTQGKYLDVGFGLGEQLFLASQLGFQVYGTELDEDAIDFLLPHLPSAHLVKADLMAAQFSNEQFDFIRFWHVIEHVRDPSTYLTEMRRVLKNDGVLMIGTPNIACKAYAIHRFISHVFQKLPTIMDGLDHTVLFSKPRLKRLLEENGFKVINQFSHGRKERFFSLLKEPIPARKKVIRMLQSFWDVDQTVYAVKA